MLSAEATLNSIDEAKAAFRSAVDELCKRAKAVHVSPADILGARHAAEDVLSDLFYNLERELKSEIGEDV